MYNKIFLIALLFLQVIVTSVFSEPQVHMTSSNNLEVNSYDSLLHTITATTILSNLNHPWGIAWIPNTQIQGLETIPNKTSLINTEISEYCLLVTERNGDVWIMRPDGVLNKLQISLPIVQSGQGGWLDIGVHDNGFVYLSYAKKINAQSTTALTRFKIQFDKGKFVAVNIRELFEEFPPIISKLHYGGMITFNNDFVFLSLGDRGRRHEAQNINTHLGSIIRLTLDGTIPQENPFVNKKSSQESSKAIFSYGHRNVQGIFFDNDTQTLFAHEHGPQGGDELNQIYSGANYGWPVTSYGKEYGSGQKIGVFTKEGIENPIKYWDPSPALSGMVRYMGDEFPQWKGNIIIGALKFQSLYRLEIQAKGNAFLVQKEERLLNGKFGRVRNIRQGPDDAIYILTDANKGKVIRLSNEN